MSDPGPRRLRPSAKAVVTRQGSVLVNRNLTRGEGEEWLGLPGGGQRPGETLVDALRREVAEETGFIVEPVRLLWVGELIVRLDDALPYDPDDHAVEFFFESRVLDDQGEPTETDTHQVGIAWLGTEELREGRFYPEAVRDRLVAVLAGADPGPVYLGSLR